MKVPPKKPHFFKPILPGFKDGLKIPVDFLKGYKHMKNAILRSAGKKWVVKLKCGRLEDNWKIFVEDVNLQLGDILVFRHEGDMLLRAIVKFALSTEYKLTWGSVKLLWLYLYMKNFGRSSSSLKSAETMRLIFSVACGVMFGVFLGISISTSSLTKLNITASIVSNFPIARDRNNIVSSQNHTDSSIKIQNATEQLKIWVPSNPKGAERLPPGLVASESDYYLRRLWGNPSEDLPSKPKCLVTFTVGVKQKHNIDAAVKKFSDDFTILLFHYDGKTTEWDDFEWSKRAIHVSARKQTKWWYAKRFLHPDIVAPYDYIFIWDEDLGVEHFDANEYIKLVKKHGLEISQPGLDPRKGTTWPMTIRRGNGEVHTLTEEKPGKCADPHLPPCAAFVEIMAPVFSQDAWRCVWHMIQNDLIHGWGLDFALHKCVEPAHEKIGVVDAQWILHQSVPSLGNEGQAKDGKAAWRGVRERCEKEWSMFQSRVENAEKDYYISKGIDTSNFTFKSNGIDPSNFISH